MSRHKWSKKHFGVGAENNEQQFTNVLQGDFLTVNPCSVPKVKNAKEPTRAALPKNPSSKRASGLLVGLFLFWY